jgi:ribosomal protein L1
VGNVGMSAEQLVQNVEAFVAALTEELPSWDRVSRITLHATRGPAFTFHSAKRRPATAREEQDE